MKSSRSIAIDFGNTRTKVAYYDEARGRPDLVEGLGVRERAILPSLFYIEDAAPPENCPPHQRVKVDVRGDVSERRVFIGDEALRKASGDDPRGLVHRLKIEINRTMPIRVRSRQKVNRVELAACLFAHIKHFCEKQKFHGESIEECSLTVPADFEIAKRDRIVEAAKAGGFKTCHVLSEPEAAAQHWLKSKAGNKSPYVVVCDVGGGTTDFALLGRNNERFEKFSEVAPRSIERGGMHVDEEIWETILEEILDRPDEDEIAWGAVRSSWEIWIRRLREDGDRGSMDGNSFSIGSGIFEVDWSRVLMAEENFNDAVAKELKQFLERCREATKEKNLPVLLAGGGSLMTGLHKALCAISDDEVYVWNDSQFATVLGAVDEAEITTESDSNAKEGVEDSPQKQRSKKEKAAKKKPTKKKKTAKKKTAAKAVTTTALEDVISGFLSVIKPIAGRQRKQKENKSEKCPKCKKRAIREWDGKPRCWKCGYALPLKQVAEKAAAKSNPKTPRKKNKPFKAITETAKSITTSAAKATKSGLTSAAKATKSGLTSAAKATKSGLTSAAEATKSGIKKLKENRSGEQKNQIEDQPPPVLEDQNKNDLPPVLDPEEKQVVIGTLKLRYGGFWGLGLGFKVKIKFDSQEVAEVPFTEPINLDLPCEPGPHTLEVKLGFRGERKYTIHISEPGTYTATLKYSTMWGNFKKDIFVSKSA